MNIIQDWRCVVVFAVLLAISAGIAFNGFKSKNDYDKIQLFAITLFMLVPTIFFFFQGFSK